MTTPPIDRREFLQSLGATALLAPGCGSPSPTTENPAPKQPNIILIMADDMGFSDIGCYGGEISTPISTASPSRASDSRSSTTRPAAAPPARRC